MSLDAKREKNRANCAAYRAKFREEYNAYQRQYRQRAKAKRQYQSRCAEIRASLGIHTEQRI
jgi:hypothetical protein